MTTSPIQADIWQQKPVERKAISNSMMMELATDWPLRKISEPHESNDVLLDMRDAPATRGLSTQLRGNKRLLQIILARKESYDQKSRMEKPVIAVEILKAEWRAQDPTGRFIQLEEHSSLFTDVGDKKARAYISKILKRPEACTNEQNSAGDCSDKKLDTSSQLPLDVSSLSSNILDWSNLATKLYEREDHVAKLREAFERNCLGNEANAELVLICGPSGSGKSELARSMKDFVASNDGFFLWGKFEQLRQTDTTYSAFFSAIRQFSRLLERKDPTWVAGLSKKVHASLGPEVEILVEAMPCLGKLLDSESIMNGKYSNRHVTEMSKERFITAFRRFIRAILDPEHPLVIVLDDVQWADRNSLDLLHSLVAPEFGERQGLLLVGTCRGNEVSVNDPLSIHLRSLESKGTSITTVEVVNLSAAALSEMMVDAGLPANQTSTLAETVHFQTRGNAFFSTQFLRNLQEEGLLTRESSDAKWEWDEDEMQLSSRDVGYEYQIVRLLTRKMRQLPPEVQEVLRVAACIGSELRENLLVHATTGVASSTVLLALSIAEERHVIHYNFDVGVGNFTHDKFREAALALIPDDQRGGYQLRIGKTLRSQLSEPEFDDNLLLIASLMAQGMDELEGEDNREKLARLCLAAARKAGKASAFQGATQFVNYGMSLLTKRHWRDQYDLSLLLYSLGSELAYCNGDHEAVGRLSQEIFDNARNPNDKLQAYTSLIVSLDAVMEFEKATEICLKVLDEHGEHFPKKVGKLGLLVDFWRTRRLLAGKTANDILNLPAMTDSNALISMSIIHLFYPVLLLHNVALSPLTAFRLIRLTMRHGLSSMSSVGFGFYASVCIRAGKINEGWKYGELALRIMKKYPVKEFEARTIISVWGNVKSESEPLASCLEPYMQAHHSALSTGDFNSAIVSLFCDVMLRLFIGDNLISLLGRIDHAVEKSVDYQQRTMVSLMDPVKQVCLNLMGKSDDPLTLTGEVMEEKQWLETETGLGQEMSAGFLLTLKLYLAMYMNDFDQARRLMEEFSKSDPGVVIPYIYKYHIFYKAIITASAPQKSFASRRRMRKHLRYMEQAMLNCPENHANKVFLIRAEIAASKGRWDEAALRYDKSIHYAKNNGLPNEQAFACERAGRMLICLGQSSVAVPYLCEAIKLYAQWGAEVKVLQLKEIMATEKLVASAPD